LEELHNVCMLIEEFVQTDLQIELLPCKASMTDCEILVDKFDCEDRLGTMERGSFLDAATVSSGVHTYHMDGFANQPCIGTLTDCLGDDSKGELIGQWGKLRMSYHCLYWRSVTTLPHTHVLLKIAHGLQFLYAEDPRRVTRCVWEMSANAIFSGRGPSRAPRFRQF